MGNEFYMLNNIWYKRSIKTVYAYIYIYIWCILAMAGSNQVTKFYVMCTGNKKVAGITFYQYQLYPSLIKPTAAAHINSAFHIKPCFQQGNMKDILAHKFAYEDIC